MDLRTTRARFDPAASNQWRPLTDAVSTAVGQLPGIQQLYQGIDRTAGRFVAVSLWNTEERAGWSRDALGDLIGRLRDLGVLLKPPEIYEVLER